jgi:hypothetical protein
MSESRLWAKGTGPGADRVALCRLVHVVAHCENTKNEPQAEAVRNVAKILQAQLLTDEGLALYLEERRGEYAHMVTEADVWRPGQKETTGRFELMDRYRRLGGEPERKWIPGVAAIAELKGVSGLLELLAEYRVPYGAKAAERTQEFLGRLAMRDSDAAALFGYGQSQGSGPSSTDLADAAQQKAIAALEDAPKDAAQHRAWAVDRVAELTAAGVDRVRWRVAQKCDVNERTVGNWIKAASKNAAPKK